MNPALKEIVERLVAAYRPERIYLFGSHARGDAGPDSDFDILVLVPDDAPPARRRSRLAYEALRGTGMAADVVVWTLGYFEDRREVPASLSATVAREGNLLHAEGGASRRRTRGTGVSRQVAGLCRASGARCVIPSFPLRVRAAGKPERFIPWTHCASGGPVPSRRPKRRHGGGRLSRGGGPSCGRVPRSDP